jgi:hypothetical protein
MDLLAMFARQAALALEIMQRAREAGAALRVDGGEGAIADLADAIASLGAVRRAAALHLVDDLAELLGEGRDRQSPGSS